MYTCIHSFLFSPGKRICHDLWVKSQIVFVDIAQEQLGHPRVSIALVTLAEMTPLMSDSPQMVDSLLMSMIKNVV